MTDSDLVVATFVALEKTNLTMLQSGMPQTQISVPITTAAYTNIKVGVQASCLIN